MIGINQNPRRAIETVLHIKYALILQAIILRPKVLWTPLRLGMPYLR